MKLKSRWVRDAVWFVLGTFFGGRVYAFIRKAA